MKNIILIISLIVAIGCGTDMGQGELYKYSIRNESGKNIIIRSYLTGFPKINPINIPLNNGEVLLKEFQDGLPPSSYSYANFFGDGKYRSDSIKVIYNGLKLSVFKGEISQNERNPLNIAIYGNTIETFIFTEVDYENAQPCNGNCE